jgi:hypothetical protein
VAWEWFVKRVLEDWQGSGKTRANQVLRQMGYDGIHHTGGLNVGTMGKHDVWIAFHPSQVKSIFAKQYDPASINIGEKTEDRLGRARSMGFDTSKVWYHATTYDFDRFVPSQWRGGIYLSPTPEGAIRGAGAGGMEHPALAGPTVGGAKKTGLSVIPCYVKGKVWGRDPLPSAWFPPTLSYGEWRRIIDGDAPIHVSGVSDKGNAFLNRERNDVMRLVYTEAVPVEQYDAYTGDNEANLPLRLDAPPVPKPFFSYEYVEGVDNYVREALRAIGFENWLVNDEGGVSLAVSNPANLRVTHARFDPAQDNDPGLNERV